ncbi:MAG TPA: hypothetical protein VMZ26_10050 [Pyrinomonadaceae bacterium]|nr:hypothetical protein [Pyrinomonadaceae bacterium]
MKQTIFLALLLSGFCISTAAQERTNSKDPDQLGSCINVSAKLAGVLNTGPIVNGEIIVWTLDEVKLMARVKEQTVNGRRTRVREVWNVADIAGNPVAFDESTRVRRRGDKSFFQRLVYTRGVNPEGCFVVEQKEQP